MNKPLISVIISVYNCAGTVGTCIESLVFQSLENIEIIIVDKESTDGSGQIVDAYRAAYPDKISVYHRPYSRTLAAAYNFAIPLAKAEYVAFADADDRYDLSAMEILYSHIQEKKSDMVRFNFNIYDRNDHLRRIGRFPKEETIEAQLLSSEMCTFWSALFRKEVLIQNLPIPDVIGPDASFIPTVISKLKKISVISRPLYNYMYGVGITSKVLNSDNAGIYKGWEFLLDHCNSEYIDQIAYFISTRIRSVIKSYWPYQWTYIQWLKGHSRFFVDNPFIQRDAGLYNFLKIRIDTEYVLIPLVIYINGFGHSNTEELQQEILCKALNMGLEDGRIVVLDENTCDLSDPELEKAYRDGKYEYLAHRFALKEIYKSGGFYVGKHINFTGTLAPILDKPSVFSFISKNTFSSEIWGARPGNPVISELLRTYEVPGFYDDPYYPLENRIKNILVAKYRVPLNGAKKQGVDFFVGDTDMFVFNSKTLPYVCEHDFYDCIGQEEYITIPRNIEFPVLNAAELNKLKRECNDQKRQLDEIYNSDSWKLIKRLKRFANSRLGLPFKRLFKKFLRVYRKQRYGMV